MYRWVAVFVYNDTQMKNQQLINNVYRGLVAVITVGLLASMQPSVSPFFSWITPPVTLFLGLAFALIFGEAYPSFNKKCSKKLLQWSVVGLGFGMNVHESLRSGAEGMTFTIVSVVGTLVIGFTLGYYLLRVRKRTSYLISAGTAICGGSAIAAVGPVIQADQEDMSVSLGTIFILNAIALFIFPHIGHWLHMSQTDFGTWAAIAIHDTSSVVGAGAAYGEQALQVATTIKLTRALWIIPVALVTSFLFRSGGKKISIPWFILFFVLAVVANTYLFGDFQAYSHWIAQLAKKSLTLTLFFIGASLHITVLKQVGIRPLLQGVLLWIIISVSSLLAILYV